MEKRYYNELEVEYEISKKIQTSYSFMFLGLLITFSLVFASRYYHEIVIISYNIYYVLVIGILAISLSMNFLIHRLSNFSLKLLFILYSVIMGLFLSPLTYVYETISIVYVLAGAIAMFASMAIYGYYTTENITGYLKYLFSAVIGMIVVSLFNLYFKSNTIDTVISIIGVLIFAIYTAVDTQIIKNNIINLYYNGDNEIIEKVQIIGALNLYIDFINLFIYLLRIFGKKRN